MRSSIRTYRELQQDSHNWSAEFNVTIPEIKDKYQRFINKRFKNHKKKSFADIVKFRYAQELNIGDLAYIPSPTSEVRIFVVEEKLHSKSNYTLLEILDDLISAEYLLWFLSRPQVMK